MLAPTCGVASDVTGTARTNAFVRPLLSDGMPLRGTCPLISSASLERVKRKWVMSVGKNMLQLHSTKIRSLRPSVGTRDR